MSVRKQLRAAVKAALIPAIPAVEGRVSGVRTFARGPNDLPAIEVTTPAYSEQRASDDGLFIATITLMVIIAALGREVEDDLDDLADAVEDIVLTDPGVAALSQDISTVSTQFDAGDGAENRPGRIGVTFQVTCYLETSLP
ncbi:MAG: hypothetical protein KDH16_18900 [Rhodocyclaceae bacterium]|nr:hypothetical protein [Rhodocyclaceae bacterium]